MGPLLESFGEAVFVSRWKQRLTSTLLRSYHDPGKSPLPLVKLIDNFDASFSVLANEGSKFSFITNLNAPRYRWGHLPPQAP